MYFYKFLFFIVIYLFLMIGQCCAKEPVYKLLIPNDPSCEIVLNVEYIYPENRQNIRESFYIGRSGIPDTTTSSIRASTRIGRPTITHQKDSEFIYRIRIVVIGDRIRIYIRSQSITGGVIISRSHELSESIYCDSVFYEDDVAIALSWEKV